MLARDRSWLAWIPALVCLAAGCRGNSTDAPVSGHHELCCKAANADNVSFVGCRASNYCRAGEEVWVRGPVRCTGGGECALAVEVAALEPEPESGEAGEAPPEAPPPAPVVPIDLDYRAEPTLESIPTLICPATVERGVEGRVLLAIEVTAEGRVSSVEIREGLDPECDALAREALKNARFAPARTPGGEPIASSMTWSYAFVADGRGEGEAR